MSVKDQDVGRIYLIRHGQASLGASDYDVLSPLGMRQAEILGHHLARQKVDFDRCISGSLKRQIQTATIVLEEFRAAGQRPPALETMAAFNEIDLDGLVKAYFPAALSDEQGPSLTLQHATSKAAGFQRLLSRAVEHWLTDSHEKESLESWEYFRMRVREGLQHLIRESRPNARIAVFTSGGPIIALFHLIADVPAAKAFESAWQIANTSLSQLSFRNGEVTLTSFNSQAHLDQVGITELITYI